MGKPVVGEIVVLPFPQTNLQSGKRRPALVVADLTGDDVILCQITSQSRSDGYSVTLSAADFERGRLAGVETSTLAAKLGTTTHLSPLLRKAEKLGLGPRELEILAAQRGCRHYSNGTEPAEPLASEKELTNEELAMALLSTALRYDPHSIRCGAAMLGAEGNNPRRLAHMAVLERCVAPVRYVAEAGRRFEPKNTFWNELLEALPVVPPPKSGVLPHPTRFVAMTGFTRQGSGLVVEWQRPMDFRPKGT